MRGRTQPLYAAGFSVRNARLVSSEPYLSITLLKAATDSGSRSSGKVDDVGEHSFTSTTRDADLSGGGGGGGDSTCLTAVASWRTGGSQLAAFDYRSIIILLAAARTLPITARRMRTTLGSWHFADEVYSVTSRGVSGRFRKYGNREKRQLSFFSVANMTTSDAASDFSLATSGRISVVFG